MNRENGRLDIFVDILRRDLSHGTSTGRVTHLAQADGSHVQPLRLDAHPGQVAPNILENII